MFQGDLAFRAVLQMALEFSSPHGVQFTIEIAMSDGL
jgi:hypothetical protein